MSSKVEWKLIYVQLGYLGWQSAANMQAVNQVRNPPVVNCGHDDELQ